MLQLPSTWSHYSIIRQRTNTPAMLRTPSHQDCDQNEPCCANCNEKHSTAYKSCQNAKQQARAVSYSEALKNKSENNDKESSKVCK